MLFKFKPKTYKCSFCGKQVEIVRKLSDGAICNDCATIKVLNKEIEILLLDCTKKFNKLTCDDLTKAMDDLKETMKLMDDFKETRKSESGRIIVDDNLGLFYIKNDYFPFEMVRPIILHKLNRITDFYLEYDFSEVNIFNPDLGYEVSSGFITIKMNEFFDVEYIFEKIDSKVLTQRLEIKKVFESDLIFLEQLTGKKRGNIPQKNKII